MAYTELPTDYTDRTWSGSQKYEMTTNSDGTVSFEDVTEYENDENCEFGAADVNAITERLNDIGSGQLNGLSFGQDSDGKWGYSTDGGTTITPFRNPTGDAEESDVLSGKVFSSEDLEDATGTMTDKQGTTTTATASLDSTNSLLKMQIPARGCYSTASYLKAAYSTICTLIGLTADKIRSGYTILGLAGSFTSDATATAARILKGYTAGVNGSMVTGTMTNRGAVSVTLDPGETYTVTSGYHNGSGTVSANSATLNVVSLGSSGVSRSSWSLSASIITWDASGISGYTGFTAKNFAIHALSVATYYYAYGSSTPSFSSSISYDASSGTVTLSGVGAMSASYYSDAWLSSVTMYCYYAS